MHAHREAGADSRELERRFQESFFQRLALGIVVAAVLAVSIPKPDRLVGFAIVLEGRPQYAASAYPFAALLEGFVNQFEAVAATQIRGEVDIR